MIMAGVLLLLMAVSAGPSSDTIGVVGVHTYTPNSGVGGNERESGSTGSNSANHSYSQQNNPSPLHESSSKLSSGASGDSSVSESSTAILLEDDDGCDQQGRTEEREAGPVGDVIQATDEIFTTPIHVCGEPFCLSCDAAVQHGGD